MIAIVIAILVSLSPAGNPVSAPAVPVAVPSGPATTPPLPPAAVASMPATIGTPIIGGNVSYAVPALGRRYLAMRLPAGTLVRLCGPGGCVVRRVNDFGPSARIRPPRIADLSWWDWLRVCGQADHSAGLCKASAELLEHVKLPATDTE